jgi:hypothetical protein
MFSLCTCVSGSGLKTRSLKEVTTNISPRIIMKEVYYLSVHCNEQIISLFWLITPYPILCFSYWLPFFSDTCHYWAVYVKNSSLHKQYRKYTFADYRNFLITQIFLKLYKIAEEQHRGRSTAGPALSELSESLTCLRKCVSSFQCCRKSLKSSNTVINITWKMFLLLN